MNNLSLEDEMISEFPNVRSKSSRVINLQEYIGIIRSDLYKEVVQRYRELKSQAGHEAEAQALKNSMPCIVPAGVCQGGHAVKNLVRHSCFLSIDMDGTQERTQEIAQLTTALPWILAKHKSISGQGFKFMVRVKIEDVERDYQKLYAAVGEAISQHVKHPYDVKCKILTQPCFYSWDPDASYHPQAIPFEMKWEEEQLLPCSEKATPVAQPTELPTLPAAQPAPGFLAQFVSDFEHRNPFVRGERNDLALKLGRAARSKGFSTPELEEIIALFSRHYAASDFTNADIRQRVSAGYQYVEKKQAENPVKNQGSFRAQTPMGSISGVEDEENEDEVLEKNNVLRAASPYIPQDIFGHLPEFLQQCVKYATNPRERDFILMGSLSCCSAALPHVSFQYKNSLNSPHLYFAGVAPAGAGKGAIAHTAILLDPIEEYYEQENRKKKKEFEQKWMEWENEQHTAQREKRNPDLDLKPEEVKGQHLKLSATTSKSRLIEHLQASGEVGCCMCSSEINTLVSSIHQECGDYIDIFCKAAQHEEVSFSYKNSGEPVVVRTPRLAINISGTQEQFLGFFRSLENGLPSRFAIYTRESAAQWESCAPLPSGIEMRKHFRNQGKELLEMHKGLLQSPTQVTFTPQQWQLHTERFSHWLNSAVVEGAEAAQAIVFRHGLLAMRIAAILTTFRKWVDYRYAKEYVCTDEDFNTAMQIAATLLEHSLLLSTSLPQSIFKPRRMHSYHRFENILSHLPRQFTFTEYMQAAREEAVPESTAKRMLKKGVESHLIVKQKDGYYKKSKTTRK